MHDLLDDHDGGKYFLACPQVDYETLFTDAICRCGCGNSSRRVASHQHKLLQLNYTLFGPYYRDLAEGLPKNMCRHNPPLLAAILEFDPI